MVKYKYRRSAEHIPGAMRIGSDALGVTIQDFCEMLSTGKVSADTFLPRLAEKLNEYAKSIEE